MLDHWGCWPWLYDDLCIHHLAARSLLLILAWGRQGLLHIPRWTGTGPWLILGSEVEKTLRVWNNLLTPWNDKNIEHISWNIPPSKPWFRAGPIHCWWPTNWRNQEIPDHWLHPNNYEKWSLWTILCTTWGLSLGLPHCMYICCRNCILFVQLRHVGSRR